MSWVLGLADVRRREVWTAETMARTVLPTARTTLKLAQQAAPTARAPPETVGERKAVSEAY
jgi:hypothetical protein